MMLDATDLVYFLPTVLMEALEMKTAFIVKMWLFLAH